MGGGTTACWNAVTSTLSVEEKRRKSKMHTSPNVSEALSGSLLEVEIMLQENGCCALSGYLH